MLTLLQNIWDKITTLIHPTSAQASDLQAEASSVVAMAMLTVSIPEGQVWKTYYYAGSQRVAMRVQDGSGGDEVYYLLSDHLGSTSVSYRASDGQTIPQYYYPWGAVRSGLDNALPSDYTFTGQRSEVDSFGLMYYNARWYDPMLGRFAHADTIVPGLRNPIAWDRYAYTLNNPTRFTDPSGHEVCDEEGNCYNAQGWYRATGAPRLSTIDTWKMMILGKFWVIMSDDGGKNWDTRNLHIMYKSLGIIDDALKGKTRSLIGGAICKWGEFVETEENCPNGGCTYNGLTQGTKVTFNTIGNAVIRQMNIYHEFGHILDNSPGMVNVFSRNPDINSPDFITDAGYLDTNALVSMSVYEYRDAIQHPYSILGDPTIGAQEHWADAFANYVAGNINVAKSQGEAMYDFVTGALAPYIGIP